MLAVVVLAMAMSGGAQAGALAGPANSLSCGGSAHLGASVGARLGCPGPPGATQTPGRPTVTTTPVVPASGHASSGPGPTSAPPPNAWGYLTCPSGAGSNAELSARQYGPGGVPTGSRSVICPSGQTASTSPPPPPPPPPSAGDVWAEVPLPAPDLAINPAGAGVTQLASWFWVTGAGRSVTVAVTIGAYTVTATASPVAYQWSFGDGSSATSASAGGEGEPSVTHTYLEKGTYPVSLAVEYAGRYSFAGPAGTGSSSLGDYEQPPVNTSYTVQEVRSVLLTTGGG
ncbi:MAG: PKD domain-containing protein [Acidimicrobiales bacterium]